MMLPFWILAKSDIHSTLSLGILFKSREKDSGNIMKELLFKASSLGITIRFYPITVEEYEEWVKHARQEPLYPDLTGT